MTDFWVICPSSQNGTYRRCQNDVDTTYFPHRVTPMSTVRIAFELGCFNILLTFESLYERILLIFMEILRISDRRWVTIEHIFIYMFLYLHFYVINFLNNAIERCWHLKFNCFEIIVKQSLNTWFIFINVRDKKYDFLLQYNFHFCTISEEFSFHVGGPTWPGIIYLPRKCELTKPEPNFIKIFSRIEQLDAMIRNHYVVLCIMMI